MTRVLRLLLLGAGLVLAGCAAVPVSPTLPARASAATPGSTLGSTAQPQRADEAIALIGTVGAMHLVALGRDGSLRPLAGSGFPGDAAWQSGDGSTLVVTTLSGATFLGAVGAAGDIAWTAAQGDLAGPHPGRAFGSLRAGLVALAEGDPGSGGPGQLIVASLAGSVVTSHALPHPAESAPTWLPDGRIVVVVRDTSDAPTALVFDPADGQLLPGPAGPAGPAPPALSVAIGGQTVASLGQDGTVRLNSVQDWLRGAPGEPLPGLDPDQAVLQVQPSLAGDELVLVLADGAGDAASIRILAGSGGWHEIARFELPSGANRAVASWLVAP